MKGMVTDIQRFSLHDGPGIRTTVFLKGCNLRCAWCHNPETREAGRQLQYLPGRCLGCGACAAACPSGALVADGPPDAAWHRRCTVCGACAAVCPAGARVVVGREMTVAEVLAEVLEDRAFYDRSGGGLTVSGGEPLCQPPFTLALLREARAAGLHTAVETNLLAPWPQVEALLPVTDLVMADVKTLGAEAHRHWTGADNAAILENLRRLAAAGARLVVRTPVVPGVNDTVEAIGAIADFLRGLAALDFYELLPYHPLGRGKYESLGLECRLPVDRPPAPEVIARLAAAARERGLVVRVAGQAEGGQP